MSIMIFIKEVFMNTYEKIKELAYHQGYSNLQEVAERAGIAKNLIYSWKTSKPNISSLLAVADVLNTTTSKLLYDKNEKVKETEPLNYQVRLPVLGNIACGDSLFSQENIIGFRDMIFDHKPYGKLFCLKCKDNSMEPLIPNGSSIIIRQQPTVKNGEIAAVLIDDEITLKRVEYYDTEVILRPENTSFSIIILNNQHPGRIVGKAVHMDYAL